MHDYKDNNDSKHSKQCDRLDDVADPVDVNTQSRSETAAFIEPFTVHQPGVPRVVGP